MTHPKVSVLMPVYNTKEEYLREAIESILNQTFTDFEFLILDDCPKNNREKIVKSFNDCRIKYFKNDKNMGITPSRNKLLKMARGEYLAVMDHDDISLPKRFEKQVEFLDTHPRVGVVGCQYMRIVSHKQNAYPIKHSGIVNGILQGSCFILHPASMIRKQVLLKNNVEYEEMYSPCEDFMLWARLIKYTKFYNLPEILFQYRDHSENTSSLQAKLMAIKGQEVLRFIHREYPKSLIMAFLSKTIRFFFQKKLTKSNRLIIKVCKIPIYHSGKKIS